jgi:hypothetical protein
MGRRPKVLEFNNTACHPFRVEKNKIATRSIAKFDIEKLELLPFKERGERQKFKNGSCLAQITRFWVRRVGRDYDEVYSEFCQLVPRKYKHSTRTFGECKMPSSFDPATRFWQIPLSGRSASNPLKVDLETRTLCRDEVLGTGNACTKEVYRPFEVIRFTTKNYAIQQLLTEVDFAKEGKLMQHCVRTYFKRCHYVSDKISIWSLSDKLDKLLTIELRDKTIVQVKGVRNRPAEALERVWLKDWAGRLGLAISDYAF